MKKKHKKPPKLKRLYSYGWMSIIIFNINKTFVHKYIKSLQQESLGSLELFS